MSTLNKGTIGKRICEKHGKETCDEKINGSKETIGRKIWVFEGNNKCEGGYYTLPYYEK